MHYSYSKMNSQCLNHALNVTYYIMYGIKLGWIKHEAQSALYHCMHDLPLYSITCFNGHLYGKPPLYAHRPPLYAQRPSLVYFQMSSLSTKAVTVACKVIAINR